MSEKVSKSESTKPEAAPVAAKPAAPAPAAGATNGLAIAALVVGIIAVVSGWAPFWGVIVGAAAVVLGIIALKKPGGKGMSIAGIITGAVGALWSLIISAFFIIAIVTVGASGAVITEAARQADAAISAYSADSKAKIDSKKDFAKGDTANFDAYQVKVNSVKANYTSSDSFYTPADGKQFILVNLTVKNISNDSISISKYTFDVDDNGVSKGAAYVTVDNELESGDLNKGASTTGNVVYEVAKDATSFKLQYSTYAFDTKTYESKKLVYTLAF